MLEYLCQARCVAGVYAPALVERPAPRLQSPEALAGVAGVYAPALVERSPKVPGVNGS